MNKQFTQCWRCGKAIYYGNAFVSISRNVEQADYELATDKIEIQVIDSEEIITLCGSCGNSFDANTIANIITSLPSSPSSIKEN